MTLRPGAALQESWLIFRLSFLHCLPLSLVFAAAQALGLVGAAIARDNVLGWLVYGCSAVGSGASAAAIVILQQFLVQQSQSPPAMRPPQVLRPGAALRAGLLAMPVWIANSLVLSVLVFCVIIFLRDGGGLSAMLAAFIAVPAAIFSVSLQLSVPVAAMERPGTLASLLRSHRLVWGNWWRTVLVMAALMVFVMLALMALVMLLALVAGVAAGEVAAKGPLQPPVTALMFVVVALVLLPAWSAVTLALYRQLALTPSPPAAPPDTPAAGAQ